MLGAAAHITGHLVYAHTTVGKMMYVGATAAALGPIVAPLIRSITSKLLPPDERGSIKNKFFFHVQSFYSLVLPM